jgi:anaerobic selenocysteine-containing dehydrogenase
MSDKLSRRDFLKTAGAGAAIAALTGCGPMSRYVLREPYERMPEYNQAGRPILYASTCGECSAGCGLVVRTLEGRVHKVEGNPANPVNFRKTCARGQAALQSVYNPDRFQGPVKQTARGSAKYEKSNWAAAVGVVQKALQSAPGQVAFLTGLFPDHLHDLVVKLAAGMGGASVLRYATLGEFESRVTLIDACQKLFGVARLPHFDMSAAEVTFSFGANFSETWLSPVAYSRMYGQMRQGRPGQRGYLVQFEPRMSQTAASADEWIPINPGSELQAALGIGRMILEVGNSGTAPAAYKDVQMADVAAATGVSEAQFERLARIFVGASRRVALPGGAALGQTNGLAAAQAILGLNVLVDNLGKPGGLAFLPDPPIFPDLSERPASLAEIKALVDKMNAGQIQVIFIHGTNPVYGLPHKLGFAEALKKVPQVISFASFPDETALQSDYIFPDHTPLESFGYQKVYTGADRTTLSGIQPAVAPLYDTKSTADVLLAAAAGVGGNLAEALPFADEFAFLQAAVAPLAIMGGSYTAPDPAAFYARFQQTGVWTKAASDLTAPPQKPALDKPIAPTPAAFSGDDKEFPLFLLPFPSPNLGDGSQANRPTLQETPDPMTTVMWNTWIEIHPETAKKLGIKDDDLVKITSPMGEIQAVAYLYPAIHPGTVAIPLGQGHTAFGRYAEQRGANVLDLLDPGQQTESGNLAFGATRVKISPTGQRRQLSRYESRLGVYGPQG